MLTDVGGLCRRVGERDGFVERFSGFGVFVQLHQEGAAGAVEIKIAAEAIFERRDKIERDLRAAELRDGDSAIERDDWRRRVAFECAVEPFDFGPIGFIGRFSARVQTGDRSLDLVRAGFADAHRFIDQR